MSIYKIILKLKYFTFPNPYPYKIIFILFPYTPLKVYLNTYNIYIKNSYDFILQLIYLLRLKDILIRV